MPSTRSQDNTDDWRSAPPYALADGRSADEYTKQAGGHRASCFCGAVKYGFSEPKPLGCKYCHCSSCQQLHGAPLQWAAIFKKDSVLFDEDSLDHIGFYDSREKSSARKLPCKVSCKACHSPLMDEGRNMCLIFPTHINGIRDDAQTRADFTVKMHIFYASRVEDVHDGIDKYAGLNGESALLDDEGNEVTSEDAVRAEAAEQKQAKEAEDKRKRGEESEGEQDDKKKSKGE